MLPVCYKISLNTINTTNKITQASKVVRAFSLSSEGCFRIQFEIFAEIRIKGSEAHVALQKILLLFQDLDSPTQILIHQFGSGSDAGSAKHEFLK